MMLPVMLDIRDRKIVFFGGGTIANRRMEMLLDAGASITVLDREERKNNTLENDSRIKFIRIDLEEENFLQYISESDLIFISTDNKTLNDRIHREAKKKGKLVNRADGGGDFIIPAQMHIGEIKIAISTGGNSPAMAKHLKEKIKECITQEDLMMIQLQDFVRERLITRVDNQKEREKILKYILVNPKIIQFLKDNDMENAKKHAIKYSEVI